MVEIKVKVAGYKYNTNNVMLTGVVAGSFGMGAKWR